MLIFQVWMMKLVKNIQIFTLNQNMPAKASTINLLNP